jgi:hypothetical protein
MMRRPLPLVRPRSVKAVVVDVARMRNRRKSNSVPAREEE